MKSRLWLWSITICLCVVLILTSQVAAQTVPQHHPRHHQYRLYDVGTFGGPSAYGSSGAISLSTAGATGAADTSISDPFYPYCFLDCFVSHAFLWRNGHGTDLGALPGNNDGNSSYGFAINNSGLVVGISENGTTDPATGFPSTSPVAWLYGHIFNLGGFGGTQGAAYTVNSRGQIVGYSTNAIPDLYAFNAYFPSTTQVRAFVWELGKMRDIGTLGGPDAAALVISDSGLVIGQSYTSFTPDPDIGHPIADPFLWDGRRMIDLGSLGGVGGIPQWVNNQGQVVGYSLLPSTGKVHAFLWDRGRLTDMTPYPSASGAFWINEAGVITGFDAPYAVVWKHGKRTALGSLPGYDVWATGVSINNSNQVVGYAFSDDWFSTVGFLWENGDMVDLNALVQPPSDITVTEPLQIDDRGEIISYAADAEGNVRAVVLVPNGDCDWGCEQRIADHQNRPLVVRPKNNALTMPRFGKPADGLRKPLGPRPDMMSPHPIPLN